MLRWIRIGIWLWAGVCAAGEEVPFAGPGEEAGLEERLEDESGEGGYSLRWRVRGKGVGKLQWYERLEWEVGERRALFLLVERDPGEARWADHAVFYWQEERGGWQVVAGDLGPGFGAGLVFARGSGRGGVPQVRFGGDSRRLGYRSSGENRALRGLALRWRGRGLEAAVMGGRVRWDGRVDEQGRVVSLPESGRHVSESEVGGRKGFASRVAGVRVRGRGRGWDAGLTLLAMRFARELDLRRPGRTEWAFRGRGQFLWAVDALVRRGRWRVRGEAGADAQGRAGGVGMVRGRWRGLRLQALYRSYAPGFHSFFGGAPSAAGMENERGLLLEAAGRGWRLYADGYRRPERTYYIPVPVFRATCGLTLEGRGVEVHVQERQRAERSRRLRVDAQRGGLRVRAEGVLVAGGERGGLLSARWQRGGWVVHGSRFRTSSYRSRLYEYERDLPGAVSVRPLYGDGWRLYLLAAWGWGSVRVGLRYRLQRDARVRHYAGAQVDWAGGR